MTTVRIAHAEPRPGRLANGGFVTHGHLVVLADDAGHRAVPIWMRGEPGESRPVQAPRDRRPAARRDRDGRRSGGSDRPAAARGRRQRDRVDIDVTEADIDELTPQVAVARIGLARPAGTREVTAGLGLGLAMAAAAGVPVRMADAVLDRVAMPVPGDDLLGPFLDRVPPVGRALPGGHAPGWPMATLPGQRPRMSRATCRSPTAWTGGTLITVSAATSSPPDYSAAAEASPRSCPRSSRGPPTAAWSRRSSPTTTAAPWSSSAARSAPSH